MAAKKKPTERAPMVFGYARVSTPKQRLQRQVDNIRRLYPDAEIVTDEYTGTTTDRPGWNGLYKRLIAGDVVVFDEVSRMARNAEQGVQLYKRLYDAGIDIEFIKEPHINTTVYRRAQHRRIDVFDSVNVDSKAVEAYIKGQGELLNGLLLALAWEQIELAFMAAQREIDYLHQRTAEGVRKAIERYEQEEAEGLPHEKNKPGNGNRPTYTSKKSIAVKAKIREWSRDFNGSMTDKQIMDALNPPVARNSFYKWKKELLAEIATDSADE